MKSFIELTNAKQGMKQSINLALVESFTELKEGTLVHFRNSTLTVKESFQVVQRKIRTAK